MNNYCTHIFFKSIIYLISLLIFTAGVQKEYKRSAKNGGGGAHTTNQVTTWKAPKGFRLYIKANLQSAWSLSLIMPYWLPEHLSPDHKKTIALLSPTQRARDQ